MPGARSCWTPWERCRSTATPTGRPPSCARPWPTCTGSPRPRCSAPTARTRSCSRLLLAFGGPGRRARCSSRRTRCTRTSRASPGPRWSRARATTTSDRPHHARDQLRAAAPRRHVPLLAEQPHRSGGAARDRGAVLEEAPGPCHRRRGLRAILPVVGADAARAAQPGPRRDPHLLQDVGHGGRTPRPPGGHPAVVAACEAVVLPYHLSAQTQVAGLVALRHVPEMEAWVARIAEERGRLAAPWGTCRCTAGPRTPTSNT